MIVIAHSPKGFQDIERMHVIRNVIINDEILVYYAVGRVHLSYKFLVVGIEGLIGEPNDPGNRWRIQIKERFPRHIVSTEVEW